jgi:phage virion morphogenesis protein
MAFKFNFKINDNITPALKRLSLKLDTKDFREPLKVISDLMLSEVQKRFLFSKSGPNPKTGRLNKWKKWKRESYRKRQKKLGYSEPQNILLNEGTLLKSLEKNSNNLLASVGSDLIYADTHNFGDKSRGIEARPYLGFTKVETDRYVKIILDYIRSILRSRR